MDTDGEGRAAADGGGRRRPKRGGAFYAFGGAVQGVENVQGWRARLEVEQQEQHEHELVLASMAFFLPERGQRLATTGPAIERETAGMEPGAHREEAGVGVRARR